MGRCLFSKTEFKWHSRAPVCKSSLALSPKSNLAQTRMTPSRLAAGAFCKLLCKLWMSTDLYYYKLFCSKNIPGNMLTNSTSSFSLSLVPQLMISLLIVYIAYGSIISIVLGKNVISMQQQYFLFCAIPLNISIYSGEIYVLKETKENCYIWPA